MRDPGNEVVTAVAVVAATVGISKTKRDTLGMLHKAMSRATCATNVGDKLPGKLPCVLTATLSSMDIMQHQAFSQLCHLVAKAAVYQNVCG